MDVFLGLLGFAILIFVVTKLQSVIGIPLDIARVRGRRHLFKKRDYAEGRKLVSYQIVFYSDCDIDDVREGILGKIQPVSSLAAIKTSFVIDRSSDDFIVFACGNKLQSFFKGALTLHRSGVGVEGSWTIISWLRHDGIVASREPMKQIVRHIHAGVLNVDPGAKFGLIPLERSPLIVTSYDLQDSVRVDYVQDFEAGMSAVAESPTSNVGQTPSSRTSSASSIANIPSVHVTTQLPQVQEPTGSLPDEIQATARHPIPYDVSPYRASRWRDTYATRRPGRSRYRSSRRSAGYARGRSGRKYSHLGRQR